MLTALREYLEKGLGGLGECRPVQLPDVFPLVVTHGYSFYRSELMGRACIIALAVAGNSYTPRMVQKQLSRVSETMGAPVVFVTRTLHPHDKERYLTAGQALVVPGKFAYLPFLALKQDDSKRPLVVTRETLSPIAQLIVLAVLEHKLAFPVLIKDVQSLLKVTPSTVQKAFKELESFSLAVRRPLPSSRTLGLEFVAEGRALWEMAQPYFVSPVKRTVGLQTVPSLTQSFVVAGIDALAEISRLNTQDPTEFAFTLEGFSKLGLEVVSTSSAPYKLQLWTYSPTLLGGTAIDIFSLILSLRGVTDDRAQIEIDHLLENFEW